MTKRAARTSEGRTALRARPRGARRPVSLKKRVKTLAALLFLALEVVVGIVLFGLLGFFWRFSQALPDVENLTNDVRPPVATTLWSQDGVLLGKLDSENRQPVTLDDIPKNLINATIATEDHNFYEHPGVDVQGIARSVIANIRGSNATRQGGSTITQQLVRNPKFADRFGLTKEKRYSRKVREALTALRMEQVYSKREILTLYLNNIYYGTGAYGIEAAAHTYFGKSAVKLDLAECALLAGLPQRPSAFSPFEHMRNALHRRDEVLNSMVRQGYITRDQSEQAQSEKLHLLPPRKHRDYPFKAPYFTWYILNDLFRRYGSDFVYSGLKIQTTLNWKMQHEAEKQLEAGLRAHTADAGCNQGALIALDPASGYIRAMVGGRNFRASQYNAVTQGRRQPGSTFKLFDYSAAFDTDSCSLYDTFVDKPIAYPGHPDKVVKNFGDTYSYRAMSCLSAIASSTNTVAVQVAQKVGIKTVIEYAHKMGITTPLTPLLPTALGASAVRPIDLATAYSVIANKGTRIRPMSVVRITDAEDNLVEEHLPELQTGILKPHTIEQMDAALQGVVEHGSGIRARGTGTDIIEGARGKTGTTTDARDAWFAGFTPDLTAVIWVANVHHYKKDGSLTYATMGGATGGAVCAPIWHEFMKVAVPEQKKYRQQGQPAAATAKPPTDEKPSRTAETPRKRPSAQLTSAEKKEGVPPPDASKIAAAQPATDVNGNPIATGQGDTVSNTTTAVPPAGAEPATAAPRVTVPALPDPPAPEPVDTEAPNRSARAVARHEPSPRVAAPARAVEPELVDVTVCVDSGDRATAWCPATRTTKMTKRQAGRLRRCRLHHPPPGEG